MGITAALGPLAELIGPAMGVARMAAGGLGKAQATNPAPGGSPFDAFLHPEQALQPVPPTMPERNPRIAEQAQMQSNRDGMPGLMASAILGDNSPDVWNMGAQDMAGPGSSRAKDLPPVRINLAENKPRSNEEMMKDQGYQINSVQAQAVPPGSPVTPFDAPAQGGVTDIPRTPPGSSQSKSVFDEDVPAPAADAAPPAMAASSAFDPQFDGSNPDSAPQDAFGGGVNAIQDWLEGSPENPLFQTGMALLASGYDGSNPFTGTQAGLNAIPQLAMQKEKTALERSKGEAQMADAAQQKQLQEALAMIASMYGGDQSSGNSPASQRSKGQAGLIR